MNKVHARSKSSKQPARRAPKSGTTVADRRILAQAAREDAEGAGEPASTVRSVKVAAKTLNPFQLTGAAFDGGEDLRSDCTAADLFSLVFDAPNGQHDDMLAQALACTCDDLDMIRAAVLCDSPMDEVIERVASRAQYRIKVAVEVARRMQRAAAEVQP